MSLLTIGKNMAVTAVDWGATFMQLSTDHGLFDCRKHCTTPPPGGFQDFALI